MKRVLWVGVLVVILIVGVGFFLGFFTGKPRVHSDGRYAPSLFERYTLADSFPASGEPLILHQRILAANLGATTTLVEDLIDAAPELLSKSSNEAASHIPYAFGKLSFPSTGNRLFFSRYTPFLDSVPKRVFSYDVQTKKFSYLVTASQYYNGPASPDGFEAIDGLKYHRGLMSPDGFGFLSIACSKAFDCRMLYLVDLWTDTARLLKTLPEGETLIKSYDEVGYGTPVTNFEWINNNQIQFDVYDLTRRTSTEPGEYDRVFLRTETLRID